MKKLSLHRRAVLRGIGGTALSLPLLECMIGKKLGAQTVAADEVPFYITAFCGVSTGFGALKDEGLENTIDLLGPDIYGKAYDIKRGLKALDDYGDLKSDISIISNLKLPWQEALGKPVPAGGRVRNWHSSTIAPLTTGVAAIDRDNVDNSARTLRYGSSSDVLVADALNSRGVSDVFPILSYRTQAAYYAGGSTPSPSAIRAGQLSFRKTGDTVTGIDPIVDPVVAWEALTANAAPADAAELAQRNHELRIGKSVLDLIGGQSERLISRVGQQDRVRLEQHFDEIRSLEKRLNDTQFMSEICATPGKPSTPQSIAGDWAGETMRGQVMADLIAAALSCGMTHTVSWMLTHAKSYMSAKDITGDSFDVHDVGHQNATMVYLEKMADVASWHINMFARLLSKLRDTPHGSGRLIDKCAATLLFEGGGGFDPMTPSRAQSPHSSENMVVLCAGGAGGLKPGRHIDGKGRHPASVLVSAMEAVGVNGGLGEVKVGIPELFDENA